MCEMCFRQQNIVTKQVNEKSLKALQKQAQSIAHTRKILKCIMLIGILMIVILIIMLLCRDNPTNIPDAFYTGRVYSDYMYYAEANVQEYWAQSRQIISCIFTMLLVVIGTFIYSMTQKKKYKKIIRQIKEIKNVLQSMR